MKFEMINAKLAWAVLIAGVGLATLSSGFVLMTGTSSGLLVAMFGAVSAQVGRLALRGLSTVATRPNERVQELVAA
jgi:hypothetical protein